MLKSIVATLLTSLVLLSPLACGSGDESDPVEEDGCVSGKACSCSGDSCDQICEGDGAGCAFKCGAGQSCTFSCPAGGCTAECIDSASCSLDCPGNSCGMTCTGTDTCQLDGCTAGCGLTCGGATTCESSCDLLNGGCSVSP